MFRTLLLAAGVGLGALTIAAAAPPAARSSGAARPAGANQIPGALYTGKHSGGDAISFRLSGDGRKIVWFAFKALPVDLGSFGTCYVTTKYTPGNGIPITGDAFSYQGKVGSETVSFNGSFPAAQSARGTIELDEGGTLFCAGHVFFTSGTWDSGELTWTASSQSQAAAKPVASPAKPVAPVKLPVLLRHANVRAEATSARGARVTYPPAVARGATEVTYSKASGTLFPLGTTTVTIVARNAAGVSRATFTVTVADTTPPTFGRMVDVTVTATAAGGMPVRYPPVTATDRVDPHVVITCTPPSGSFFPVGTKSVTCVARDRYGNRVTARFAVIVNPAPAPPPTTVPPLPPPPTTTPVTSAAQPGHYVGKTTQGSQLTFDVSAGGASVQNLGVSSFQVLERDCGAAGLGDWAGFNWTFSQFSAPISAGGAFSMGKTFNGTDSEFGPVTLLFSLAGQFSGTTAAGTTSLEMKFNYQGVGRDCLVNLSWNASK